MADRPKSFVPYLSAEVAFLGFANDFRDFIAAHPSKPYLRSGPKDSTSTLRPREVLGLAIAANVAMYLSGYTWVPGYFVAVDGTMLPEDEAHDGGIRCTSGPKAGSFMHFEQAMATEVARNATPDDIEGAIIHEVNRKSERGDEYVANTGLLLFVDYNGVLGDLRKLAQDVSGSSYKAIYLICSTSSKLKDFVCVILKSPGDKLGSIGVKFDRPDGVADVSRLHV
jgi:hypothetical protein